VAVGHLEAVHEAVTSEVAARRRSGSESAIGRRNLIGLGTFTKRGCKRRLRCCECACVRKQGDHHENSRNFAR